MDIAKLRTNFQDDIINTEVTDKRRYNLIQNTDGTVSLEDVTIYEQVGSTYGAQEINTTNTTVNQLIDHTSNIDNTKDSEKSVKYAGTAGSAESAKTSGKCDNDFILCNQQTLVFLGNSCTIKDDRITANSLADVYFTLDTIDVAEEAVISVETFDGEVVLTAIRAVNEALTASIRIRVV